MIGNLTIVGVRGTSGSFEGREYNSTKLNILVPYSRNDKGAAGFDTRAAKFGTETNAQKFKDKRYPLVVECDYEIVPSGPGVVYEIYDVIKIHESPASQLKATA